MNGNGVVLVCLMVHDRDNTKQRQYVKGAGYRTIYVQWILSEVPDWTIVFECSRYGPVLGYCRPHEVVRGGTAGDIRVPAPYCWVEYF